MQTKIKKFHLLKSRFAKSLSVRGQSSNRYRGETDDLLDLRRVFEPRLYDNFKPPRTVKAAIDACVNDGIEISRIQRIESSLLFPKNEALSNKILEFIFNRSIDSIPLNMRTEIGELLAVKHRHLTTVQAALEFGACT